MSKDNYLLVDHDGRKYLLYEGSMSDNEDPDYEPPLYDVAKTADAANLIIDDYGYAEYGVEWTDDARIAAGITTKAVSKVIEQLSELNIKVVNMANKLDEHLKEVDAHHPALIGKKKK